MWEVKNGNCTVGGECGEHPAHLRRHPHRHRAGRCLVPVAARSLNTARLMPRRPSPVSPVQPGGCGRQRQPGSGGAADREARGLGIDIDVPSILTADAALMSNQLCVMYGAFSKALFSYPIDLAVAGMLFLFKAFPPSACSFSGRCSPMHCIRCISPLCFCSSPCSAEPSASSSPRHRGKTGDIRRKALHPHRAWVRRQHRQHHRLHPRSTGPDVPHRSLAGGNACTLVTCP